LLWSSLLPCDHTSSSTSCLSAIPPTPSEDYPVLGQLYFETEVNIKIIPQFNPLLFVTTLPRPRVPNRFWCPPANRRSIILLHIQTFLISGDITLPLHFRTIRFPRIPRFQEPAPLPILARVFSPATDPVPSK
ncbi:unnamed protein product, partial [Cyprideis torosa]